VQHFMPAEDAEEHIREEAESVAAISEGAES